MQNQKLAEVWPELRDEELVIAEETLAQYLALAWEIYEELNPEISPP